jgi:hypothetical protein
MQLAYLPMIGAVIMAVFTFFVVDCWRIESRGGGIVLFITNLAKMSQSFPTGGQQTTGKQRAQWPTSVRC